MPLKLEDLVSMPSSHVISGAANPARRGHGRSRHRRLPGASWPANLEKSGSPRFCERLCLQKEEEEEEEWGGGGGGGGGSSG